MLYQQITQNKRKTWVVLGGYLLLMLLVGCAIGYVFFNSWLGGLLLALIITVVYMFSMVGNATNVVMRMNHAHEITKADQPQLWHTVEDMALVAQVPMPRVFIIDEASPNAFATGRDPGHAAVAATTGLLDLMNREELEGVIGHEISHIRNYDIRLATIGAALAAAISLLVNIGTHALWWGGGYRRDNDRDSKDSNTVLAIFSVLLIVLAPLAATLAQMALSRNREYLADASSVALTRNPLGLIHALEKLAADSKPLKTADQASAAMYITNPLKNTQQLFATHPPIPERIQRLEKM